VAALSMVGLPPMAGFFSKWYLALGTIKNSSWLLLAVILVSSLLNAVYFFRVLEKVYMKKTVDKNPLDSHETEEEVETKRDEVSASMLIPTLIMAVGLIILGLLNAIIVKGIIAFIIPEGM